MAGHSLAPVKGFTCMRWKAFLIASIAVAAHAQSVVWTKFDPAAIRVGRADPALLEVQTSGAVSSVALDFAGGDRATLTSSRPNRWTAMIDASRLLFDYKADDVNHNFVGFLRLLGSGGETLATYNEFIDVLDVNVPPARVTELGGAPRTTTRVLNLYRPALSTSDVRTVAQQFYTYYPDDFDFLELVFSVPSYSANRCHFAVRNDVSGIGLLPLNTGSLYGSASRLLGISVFPIDTLFDAAETAFIHETGHQWINYLKNPALMPGPHWPPSTMARGIMGFNIPPTNEGGDFPWNIVPVTSSTARTTPGQVRREFDDFDLYLRGFIPASAVAPGLILQQTPCANCVIATAPITINDVIQVNGPRVPACRVGKDFVSRRDRGHQPRPAAERRRDGGTRLFRRLRGVARIAAVQLWACARNDEAVPQWPRVELDASTFDSRFRPLATEACDTESR